MRCPGARMVKRETNTRLGLISVARRSVIAATEPSLRTSVGSASAASALPRCRISARVRSMRAASKSATTMRAPCLASTLAAILPTPLAPPTTSATLPEKAPRGRSCSSTKRGFYWSSAGVQPLNAAQDRDRRGEGEVELDGHDQGDAPVHVDDAHEHGDQVQELGAVDTPPHEAADRLPSLVRKDAGAQAVLDGRQKRESHDQDVQPVKDEGDPRPVEAGQQLRRKRDERDRQQKRQVDPRV